MATFRRTPAAGRVRSGSSLLPSLETATCSAELGLPVDDQPVFVAIDFESQSLRDGLDSSGFDWRRPTRSRGWA